MLVKSMVALLPLLGVAAAAPATTEPAGIAARQDSGAGFVGGEYKRSACAPGSSVKVGVGINPYVKLSPLTDEGKIWWTNVQHESLGTTWANGELTEWVLRCGEAAVEFKLGIYPFEPDWAALSPTQTLTCTLSGMPENDHVRVEFYPGKPYNGVTASSGDFAVKCE